MMYVAIAAPFSLTAEAPVASKAARRRQCALNFCRVYPARPPRACPADRRLRRPSRAPARAGACRGAHRRGARRRTAGAWRSGPGRYAGCPAQPAPGLPPGRSPLAASRRRPSLDGGRFRSAVLPLEAGGDRPAVARRSAPRRRAGRGMGDSVRRSSVGVGSLRASALHHARAVGARLGSDGVPVAHG